MFTEQKLIEIINSSPVAHNEGLTINITSPKNNTSPKRNRSPGREYSEAEFTKRNKSPKRKSSTKIGKTSKNIKSQSSTVSSRSRSRSRSPNAKDEFKFALNNVFYEEFGFSPTVLPNYNELYEAVYDDLVEYVDDPGTMEYDAIVNGISLFLFGMRWPSYATNDTQRQIFRAAYTALRDVYEDY